MSWNVTILYNLKGSSNVWQKNEIQFNGKLSMSFLCKYQISTGPCSPIDCKTKEIQKKCHVVI